MGSINHRQMVLYWMYWVSHIRGMNIHQQLLYKLPKWLDVQLMSRWGHPHLVGQSAGPLPLHYPQMSPSMLPQIYQLPSCYLCAACTWSVCDHTFWLAVCPMPQTCPPSLRPVWKVFAAGIFIIRLISDFSFAYVRMTEHEIQWSNPPAALKSRLSTRISSHQ